MSPLRSPVTCTILCTFYGLICLYGPLPPLRLCRLCDPMSPPRPSATSKATYLLCGPMSPSTALCPLYGPLSPLHPLSLVRPLTPYLQPSIPPRAFSPLYGPLSPLRCLSSETRQMNPLVLRNVLFCVSSTPRFSRSISCRR
jgi:hypothetical protein